MSTKSIFIFNYNPNEKDYIIRIIKQYLLDNNFTKRNEIWAKISLYKNYKSCI